MSDEFTTEDFLGGYQPPRVTVYVCQRSDLLARHSELQRQLDEARQGDEREIRVAEAPAVLAQIVELEDEIAAAERPFTFEGLGSQKYQRLLWRKEHRPRPQDAERSLEYNPEKFAPALVAASSVKPDISPAQAEQLYEQLSDSQFGKLWMAAMAVNIGADDAPKSVRRSDTEDSSVTPSSTPASEGSPSASSSDES